MIDLHIHTVYSDGELTHKTILGLSKRMWKMAVTDHNSVGMALSLSDIVKQEHSIESSLKGFIVGVEITIEGYPDLLVYYPHITIQDIDVLRALESHLQEVRIQEEMSVKEAYNRLGFSQWELDKKRAFPVYARVAEARTRELAAICYMKRTGDVESYGHFEFEDLCKARIARRDVERNLERTRNNPYDLAKCTSGELVLAHPIRTAIKYANRCTDYDVVVEYLDKLIDKFLKHGGNIIEWEYLECEINQDFSRYPVLRGQCKNIREHIKKIIDIYSFQCVWGTDTHRKYPQDYESWDRLSHTELTGFLPYWLNN